MMRNLLVSGVDDGFFPIKFKGKKGKTVLSSVTYDDKRVVYIDLNRITVDGNDGTDAFRTLRKGDITILDGVIYAGFNYITPDQNYIIFYSSRPNIEKIKEALIKHFYNENEKISYVVNILNGLSRITTKWGDVFIYTDLKIQDAVKIIEKYQFFSIRPEPLRTAHIISSSVARFLLNKHNSL
ncbi:hypothetical protein HS7_07330 [Sulfolobales archaeon HS-7]|nr:hypothetical protein HS7_07330 [Sulfolobales archaeon HS-7]